MFRLLSKEQNISPSCLFAKRFQYTVLCKIILYWYDLYTKCKFERFKINFNICMNICIYLIIISKSQQIYLYFYYQHNNISLTVDQIDKTNKSKCFNWSLNSSKNNNNNILLTHLYFVKKKINSVEYNSYL